MPLALNILSYNTHVGITATNRVLRIANAWQHLLPSRQKLRNIRSISDTFRQYDIVGIQESDAGSLRSGFINHTEVLSHLAGLEYWDQQVNRNWGIARHSMGAMSRYAITGSFHHRLPGSIPGRSLMVTRFDIEGRTLIFAVTHLSLGRKDRIRQAIYIGNVLKGIDSEMILAGDFNCGYDSRELAIISSLAGLRAVKGNGPTYPSWAPRLHLDHIMVSRGIEVDSVKTLDNIRHSDHLPLNCRAIIV